MPTKRIEKLSAFLAGHRVGVLSLASTAAGAYAMPVSYRSTGLDVDCLVPRWADLAFLLEARQLATLIVPSSAAAQAVNCWLRVIGTAHVVAEPDWALFPLTLSPLLAPQDLYVVIRITPQRIDLVDESLGWGARETVEL